MADIASANGNVVAQNSFSDNSPNTTSESHLQSGADTSDLTTADKLSKGETTAERLKSAQSPLDNLLSDAVELIDDATDAMTDMATDAYEGLEALNQEYALAQRGLGALKTLGGLGEAYIGLRLSPAPVLNIGGTIIFVHGADVAWSGVQGMWYGKPVGTLTNQAVAKVAKFLGADEAVARSLGDGTDIGLSLGSAGVGAYQALTRPVITQLEPLTFRPQAKPITEVNATRASTDDKLVRYLLNKDQPVGGSKARWFEKALGFNKNNADDLAKQIVFDEKLAVPTELTKHGQKFNQVIAIQGTNGRTIDVNFGWIRNNDGVVRLTTGIPVKK